MSPIRKFALGAASIFYVIAGILHFLHPQGYVKIVPPFVPEPLGMVYISGAAEIAGGIGLLLPVLRRAAAWGLVTLLIAVLPANIYMAMDRVQVTANPLPGLLLWARVPLQLVLIWWVLWCSETVSRAKPNQ